MQDETLTVPLVFKSQGQVSDLERACSLATTTRLVTWGLAGWPEGYVGDAVAGAAMGCEDGSVYIFSVEDKKQQQHFPSLPDLPLRNVTNPSLPHSGHASRAPSPLQPPSPASSQKQSLSPRNASGSSNISQLLTQHSRARTTSAISKASAEAPKNYIDFDEEKEKLEGIVKNGPPPKPKTIIDGLRLSFAVANMGLNEPTRRSGVAKLSSPVANSASTSPRNSVSLPPSSSPSPSSSSSHVASSSIHDSNPTPPLSLKFHIFSSMASYNDRIAALHYLSSGILLSLQACGILSVISASCGLCLETTDLNSEPRFHPPPSSLHLDSVVNDKSAWIWQTLQVVESPEAIIISVAASNQVPEVDDDLAPRSRITIFQMQKSSSETISVPKDVPLLDKVAEWIMSGLPKNISVIAESNTATTNLFYLNPQSPSTITAQEICIVPQAFAITAPDSLQPSADAISSASVLPTPSTSSPQLHSLLSIPNPFKPKDNGSSFKAEDSKVELVTSGRVVLGPLVYSGPLPLLEGGISNGLQVWNSEDGTVKAIMWNQVELIIFETSSSGNGCKTLARSSQHGLCQVEKLPGDFFLLIGTQNQNSIARLTQETRLDIQTVSDAKGRRAIVSFISPSLLLGAWQDEDQSGSFKQYLAYALPISKTKQAKRWLYMSWGYPPGSGARGSDCEVSSILPVELDTVIIGLSNGTLRRSSLATLLTSGWRALESKPTNFNVTITSMHLVKNRRTSERVIIAGGEDGSISVWNLPSLNLLARWTVFISPLMAVIPLEDENVGRLKGCALCVSRDGTIAVITVDGLEFLYVIPGSISRLSRICLGEDNLLLIYSDGHARLWDVRTQEFWRSMTSKIADELLKQGGWFETTVDSTHIRDPDNPLSSFQFTASQDAASTLFLNMSALLTLINPIPTAHSFRDPRMTDISMIIEEAGRSPEKTLSSKKRPRRLRFLKSLLSALYTFGLDATADKICKEILGIEESKSFVGTTGAGTVVTLPALQTPADIWRISPEHTASRLLALITTLRCLLVFDEECEQYVNQVIAFYVVSLPEAVGHSWQAPSLSFLARYWLHGLMEIRLAARALFGAAATRLSDEDTIRLVEYWQHALPCLQPDMEKQSPHAALALLLAGNIAIERYAVLSASTLTDIAKSITLYLHDDACPHRALAIDLCSRGFQIWQHYVDAMEVLRSLFNLATSPDKERNVGPQARMSVLQIASGNTPLFMTTLSLDILHPKSLLQRKTILQLVAYIIRKKPLVLHPNLPRLVEAVVKSLDPSSSADRDAVIDAATEILGQVVKFFPSADFHMPTQRLCVGTSEGAVIMYDLKTATRLYVLEGHRKRLDACSFSPDGRRLVTVSLEESLVRVWKVGSSITSLFMPGAPPRQGHSGSEPYKTIPFNVGDEANMTTAAVLENVRFEWPAERTARLKIRDNTFTFNT